MSFIIYAFLILLGFTVFTFIKEPRTLLLGVFTGLTALSAFLLFLLGVERFYVMSSGGILYYAVLILLALIGLLVLSGPVIVILTLLINGVKILKKEGFAFRNLLSLGLGIFFLLYAVFSLRFFSLFPVSSWEFYVITYFNLLLFYFLFLASAYTASGFLNRLHLRKKKKLAYVVVLGAGLNKDKVTPLLAGRIDKGIEIYKKNPGSKLIMSGGKGKDELISEVEAMRNYAVEKGVVSRDILLENKSSNTEENIRFSFALMEGQKPKFALVTNHYHLFRALLLAKEEGIRCIGFGAKAKFYFSLNAFVREFIGYLFVKRKLHIRVLLALSILYLLASLASFLLGNGTLS